MDRVFLKGIKVSGIHGVLESEKEKPQPFEVDISVFGRSIAVSNSDDLGDSVDYSKVGNIVVDAVANTSFNLIESLAQEIAARILLLRGVDEVEVTVKKLYPPVSFPLDHAGVTIRRSIG